MYNNMYWQILWYPCIYKQRVHVLTPAMLFHRTSMYITGSSTVTIVNYTDWRTVTGPRTHTVTVLITEAVLVRVYTACVVRILCSSSRTIIQWIFIKRYSPTHSCTCIYMRKHGQFNKFRRHNLYKHEADENLWIYMYMYIHGEFRLHSLQLSWLSCTL